MKRDPRKVASRTVAKPADHIRMPHTVEGDRLILEVLYQRSFEIGIEVILKENIKCLDHDAAMQGLCRREGITSDEDLGMTSPTEDIDHVIPLVDPAIAE